MDHKYNKGSEWRKWDLHVHTPDSIFHNYNADDLNDVWDRFIIDIESLPKEIKVIGINDYLFIDGYRRILKEKSNGKMSNIELFLPVIELRIAKFGGNKQFKRVNFHVIFSDDLTPDVIQGQFLNALSAKYTLTHGVNKDWWGGVIDRENLQKLGEKIIESIPDNERANYGNPIKEGFNNLNLEENQIFEALHNYHGFEGKFITAIGKTEWDEFKWNDNSISEKKTIINNVDIVFTAAETVEKFRIAKEKLKEQNVNDLLLDCSDAHYNIDSDNKDRLGNCNTWIKSTPTFDGLKQILCEPLDRVMIQESHPDNRKYYNIIDSVRFVNSSENKFQIENIGFNSGLNAIIGGKSSGKSLLLNMMADEMGAKNSKTNEYKDVISGAKIEVYYKDDPAQKRNNSDGRKIEFLPQLYINDLVSNKEHKETTDRSFNTFIEELIRQDDGMKRIMDDAKTIIASSLSSIDSDVTEWNLLDNQLTLKKEERSKLGDKTAIENEIKRIVLQIEQLKAKAGWTEDEKEMYNKLIKENENHNAKLSSLEQENLEAARLRTYLNETIKISILDSITFSSTISPISDIMERIKTFLCCEVDKTVTLFLSEVTGKIDGNLKLMESIRSLIIENNKLLEPLVSKNTTRVEIEKFEKLKIEEEGKISLINEKDTEIQNIKNKIINLQFILHYQTISDAYYQLAIALNAAISAKWNEQETKLQIKALTVFKSSVFVNSIIGVVNNKSYLSNQFNKENDIIFEVNEYNYNVGNHINNITKLLHFAIGETTRYNNFKSGKNSKEFLTALLKDCFTIEYDVIKDGDSLHKMSEGKKGIVVLQLYLSLSGSDCPILIDQPEDNLDNRTVYKELNDYIKQCKKRRQIIMVSHNANLVVNTDAENIIVANQSGEDNKDNKNYKFEYVNGALENTFTDNSQQGILYKQGIREHVCEILEGGVEAFKKREEKYHIKS